MIKDAYNKEQAKYDVLAVGHICLDLSPNFNPSIQQSISDVFIPGRLINTEGITISPGGPVANTGFALSRLGLNVLPVANIGEDAFGRILSDIIFKETGNQISVNPEAETSYSVILSVPGIDRIILHDPAGNHLFREESVDNLSMKRCKLMHFGYPPLMRNFYNQEGVQLKSLFVRAKGYDVTTSLDMSLPDIHSEAGRVNWEGLLADTLPYVDVFSPSIEEALFMFDYDEYTRV